MLCCSSCILLHSRIWSNASTISLVTTLFNNVIRARCQSCQWERGFFSLFLLLSAKGSNTAPTRAVWHGKAITADRKTFYLESRAQVHIRNQLPTTAVFREQMQTPPPAPRLPSSASLPHLFSVSQQCSFFSFLSSSLSVAFCPAGSTFVFK